MSACYACLLGLYSYSKVVDQWPADAIAQFASGGKIDINFLLNVNAPLAWSPDLPSLYELTVQLTGDNDEELDTWRQQVGLRTATFDAENGFLLNGKPTILFGGNVHHDRGPLGAASFDVAEVRRVRLLKAAGFNAVRTSHNPPSASFLDECDRQGMLVLDEAFGGWAKRKMPNDYGTHFDQIWPGVITAIVAT